MSLIENRDPTEDVLGPDYSAVKQGVPAPGKLVADDGEMPSEAPTEEIFSDQEILNYIGQEKRRARNYQQVAVFQDWEESEAAFRSVHHDRSKYHKQQYKNRSRYFKPKTRNAVTKNLTKTNAVLFSSADVITTEASDDLNPLQQANAELIKEVLNQRLNNKSVRAGVPWRQIVLGARQQTQVMGMCASKAYWSYKTKKRTEMRQEQQPVLSADGQPVVSFATGEPIMQAVESEYEITDVLEDKPVVDLYPLELLLFNPAASWIDPVRTSPSLIVQHPMFADDIGEMMRSENGKTRTPWREVNEEIFAQAIFSEDELVGLKQARQGEGAKDSQRGSRTGGTALSGQGRLTGTVIDVWENFFRVGDTDYHCWSLRNMALLSDPVPVEEVYPEFRGDRPYRVGTDMIEPFVLYPESDVHSWQQQQQEINDLTNLRMDSTRKSIYPTALVKSGKNIDYRAVQRQDSQNLVLIRDDGDVSWDRPPGPHPSSYQEMNYLNNDFDESAGQFSQSTVQTNRQLNETVGGMQLMSQGADASSEFKLSLFIETWVEPVLMQIIALEQYYEDDATLLAICGKKAQLFQKFGVDAITDELLESEITVSVNAGGGASDPLTRLAKFKTAFQTVMPILAPGVGKGEVDFDYKAIADEGFSFAGYRNGADRFIKVKKQDDQTVPADKVKQMMEVMQQMKQEIDKLQSGEQTKVALKQMDLQDNEKDRALKFDLAQMDDNADMREKLLDATHDSRMKGMDHSHEVNMSSMRLPSVPPIPGIPEGL